MTQNSSNFESIIFFLLVLVVFDLALSVDRHSIEARNQVFHALILSNPAHFGVNLANHVSEVLSGVADASCARAVWTLSKVDPSLPVKDNFALDAGPQLFHACRQELRGDYLALRLFLTFGVFVVSALLSRDSCIVILGLIAVFPSELISFFLNFGWHDLESYF